MESQSQTRIQTQTFLPSPTSSSTNSNTTANVIYSTTPTTPKQQAPLTRSETNPYPTTFVQADTSSFKQVVQMLTGSSDPTTTTTTNNNNNKPPSSTTTNTTKQGNPIPPIKTPTKSKLYERRSTTLKNLRLTTSSSSSKPTNQTPSSLSSPHNAELLSPSLLDFPSLVLSPVTPLIHDPFLRSPTTTISSTNSSPNDVVVDKFAEDKAIAEKGFFLHPSPVSTPRDSEPRLLTLFPLSSPRVSDSSSSGSHPTS